VVPIDWTKRSSNPAAWFTWALVGQGLVRELPGVAEADAPACVSPEARSPQAPKPPAAKAEHRTSATDWNLRDTEHLR
jgi:hypothetical protein